MFDLQLPFFRPLWLRLAVVAVCLGWAGMEMVSGSPGWAILFAAAGLWAAYQFFVAWDPKLDDERKHDA
ncbi:MAG: hypothetical protein B7Z02_17805 [Rhodobacterales bacterium 32-67-9]|nr:MAG: hypothetical protein B7Z02_17805 [Rhodobacterales bacterium 32-67-9]